MRHFKFVPALVVLGVLVFAAAPAQSDQLPANCTKVKGTVTCTTFEGPGNNQAGVGTTTFDQTQGNTTNKSPDPQDLQQGSSCKPPTSNGLPCNP
jgi:hypothetical protein